MSRSTFAEINIDALENNWKILSQLKETQFLIPVIKANAYGHGVGPIAFYLQSWGAKRCAVAMYEEALVVRASGFHGPILILGPIFENEYSEIEKNGFIPVIGDSENLLELTHSGFRGKIHIKWDTGMNRLGLKSKDIEWLKDFKKKHPQIEIEAFCTHFLNSSDYLKLDGYCETQRVEFKKITHHFPEIKEKHIFNSDSLFAEQQVKLLPDIYGARPGLSLYGYSGFSSMDSQKLIPVMTLKSKITHIVRVSAGETVSYNASWKAQRNSVIAVLPIGYADGYPRNLSNKGQVFVHQMRVPLVGIVCMDYLMIDVTDVKQAKVGDEVELWGNHISLDNLAQASGTIVYELLTALTARVPRIVITSK